MEQTITETEYKGILMEIQRLEQAGDLRFEQRKSIALLKKLAVLYEISRYDLGGTDGIGDIDTKKDPAFRQNL